MGYRRTGGHSSPSLYDDRRVRGAAHPGPGSRARTDTLGACPRPQPAPAGARPPVRAARRETVIADAVCGEELVQALAHRPYAVMVRYLGTTLVAADPLEVVTGPAVWEALDIPVRPRSGGPLGGWLGYLGYDLGVRGATARSADAEPTGPPTAVLCRYGALAEIGAGGRCRILGAGRPARRLADAAARGGASPRARRQQAAPAPESSLDATAYAVRVREIVRRIAAGDCSQVNLVQRLSAPWGADAAGFAARLWAAAGPAEQRAYLGTPHGTLVSASPERLLTIRDNVAVSDPIKGTGPPGAGAELADSPKDRSEHVMIVDLVRNDLGRVARPGGVSVPRLMASNTFFFFFPAAPFSYVLLK